MSSFCFSIFLFFHDKSYCYDASHFVSQILLHHTLTHSHTYIYFNTYTQSLLLPLFFRLKRQPYWRNLSSWAQGEGGQMSLSLARMMRRRRMVRIEGWCKDVSSNVLNVLFCFIFYFFSSLWFLFLFCFHFFFCIA